MTDRPDKGHSARGGAVFEDEALDVLLQQAVQLVTLTIDRDLSVSISMLDGERVWTSHATSPTATVVDEAQYEVGEGPCLEAIRSLRQLEMSLDEMRERWPHLGRIAETRGIEQVLSTPLLRAEGGTHGALNVYGGRRASFEDQDKVLANTIAAHAAVLVDRALELVGANELNEQLRAAVASREIIGEAKGILMERESCTRDTAFDILRRASQRENRKLRDVAEELVERVEARARQGDPGR